MSRPKIAAQDLTYDNFQRCCRQALAGTRSPQGRAYAQAGTTLHELYSRASGRLSDAVQWQAGYLRGNVGDWKGPEARECKLWLDAYARRGLA